MMQIYRKNSQQTLFLTLYYIILLENQRTKDTFKYIAFKLFLNIKPQQRKRNNYISTTYQNSQYSILIIIEY